MCFCSKLHLMKVLQLLLVLNLLLIFDQSCASYSSAFKLKDKFNFTSMQRVEECLELLQRHSVAANFETKLKFWSLIVQIIMDVLYQVSQQRLRIKGFL